MASGKLEHVIVSAGLCLALIATAADGFAVFNDGAGPVTFLAWPVAGQTFKAVVQPGESASCPFTDSTCTAAEKGDFFPNPLGQCDDIVMLVKEGALDTNALTSQLILDEVKQIVDVALDIVKLFSSFIPEVGQAVKLGATLVKEGVDLADLVAQTGINFTYDDIFINGGNGGQFHYTDVDTQFATTAEGC